MVRKKRARFDGLVDGHDAVQVRVLDRHLLGSFQRGVHIGGDHDADDLGELERELSNCLLVTITNWFVMHATALWGPGLEPVTNRSCTHLNDVPTWHKKALKATEPPKGDARATN